MEKEKETKESICLKAYYIYASLSKGFL